MVCKDIPYCTGWVNGNRCWYVHPDLATSAEKEKVNTALLWSKRNKLSVKDVEINTAVEKSSWNIILQTMRVIVSAKNG